MESANLDFLRTTAIGLVVLSHLTVNRGNPIFAGLEFSMLGQLGVCLFFVHTSWVLMLSLKRQTQDFKSKNFLSHFYIRRFFRIYPLSIVVVFLIWFFGLPMVRCVSPMMPARLDTQEILANFGLYQNFYKSNSILGPLWSLPVEIQMYLTLPFLFLFAQKKSSAYPLIAVWGVLTSLFFWAIPMIHEFNRETLTYYQIPNIISWTPCFLAGIVAYKISETQKARPLAFFTLPVLVLFLTFNYLHSWDFIKNYFVTFALALSLPFIKELESPWIRQICKTIAKYSYSIYLLHYFSLWIVFEYWQIQNLFLGVVAFFGSLAVFSFGGYHLIENPGIKIGNRFARRLAESLPNEQKRAA